MVPVSEHEAGNLYAPMTPKGLEWIPLGEHACGLVFGGRVVALVYWQDAQPGGEHEHSAAGFWWVPADLPVDHFSLFAASNPTAVEWARAREHAAIAYADWAPREAAYTAELRHEAAELSRRARMRQEGWLQESPLRVQARSPKNRDRA
jgi:hypothetical protein